MSDAIIKVEGLGKKYIISHEQRESYTALRDVITRKARKLAARQKLHTTKEEFWALKDVNFEIKQGEAVGIIGRNGAGKSTLLKILSRITEPSTGRIELNGRVASLLEVGTGFHPELTGRENIFLNGAILGMSQAEIKRKFDEIVDFSGVEKFLDTPVKRYSSGMYVRLAFAVAAHLEPEILVVDEVLAVGDAEFQKKCLGKMDEVAKSRGRTVLFVSHNMGAILSLCDKGVFMENGELKYYGNTQLAVDAYLLTNQTSQIQRVYTREQNVEGKDLYLKSAHMNDSNNQIKADFDISEEIFIFLTIICKRKIPNLYGYFSVLNKQNEVFIESDTFDYPPNCLDNLKEGENNFYLKINPFVLAHGDYIVYLSFASSFSDKFLVDVPGEILSFSISDAITQRGHKRISKTSQLIKWEVVNA